MLGAIRALSLQRSVEDIAYRLPVLFEALTIEAATVGVGQCAAVGPVLLTAIAALLADIGGGF